MNKQNNYLIEKELDEKISRRDKKKKKKMKVVGAQVKRLHKIIKDK